MRGDGMARRFWASQMNPGMRLPRSVVTKEGNMLLAKDCILTWEHIQKLRSMEAYWQDDGSRQKPAYQKAKDEKFNRLYQNTVKTVRKLFKSPQTIQELPENEIRQVVKVAIQPLVESHGIIDQLHTIRCKDEYTLHHSVKVAVLSGVLATWLHYSETDLKDVILAGLLHDIGKIGIPGAILNKPSSLTVVERECMQQHTLKGYEIIKDKKYSPNVLAAVLQHHEKLDGTGYPRQLKGNDIHPFARIVAVADIYDALTSDRVYHKGKTPFEAVSILHREMFGQLDPGICMVFLNNIRGWIVGNSIQLSDGRVATVISLNQDYRARPVICTNDGEVIDLEEAKNIEVIIDFS